MMLRMQGRHFAIALILALAVFGSGLETEMAAQAQAGTGQIVGTVYDASGSIVPQAKINLKSKDTGLSRDETAGDDGTYRFILLPVGNYTVTFVESGFKTYKVDVEVTVGAAITINASLAVGEVAQTVEVQSSALIESTQPTPDALIDVRSIAELPINGGRFQDFASLTPTVQIEPQRGTISFAGQRGINSNVTIDGGDYNEPFFGGIRGGERSNNAFTIPLEAISQFQVVASGYSVEFGRSSGGVLNATTKSGTNDLHGSAFFFARHNSLAVNDALNRQAITSLYQEGGSIGGRIRKDKLFYFAAFENQKNDNPRTTAFTILPASVPANQLEAFNFYQSLQAPFVQTNDALSGFGRLDYQISSNHRLSGNYHYSKNTGENAVATGDAISPITNRSLSNNGTEGDRTNTVVGQWTAVFSPRVVMETRGIYSLENRPRIPNLPLTANIQTNIGLTGTREFLPTTLDDWRTQVANNMTWTVGAHAIKFGGDFNFIRANQNFRFNQFGTYAFRAATDLTLQFLSFNPGLGGNNRLDHPSALYQVNIGNGLLNADLKQIAFFIQDTWRLTPRLTITGGFRWEGYVNPQPDVSNTTFYNSVKNFPFPIGITVDPAFIPNNYRQYMPRVGLAWDPHGNAKTVIRANAGFFYAPTPLLILASPLNNFRSIPGDLSVNLPLRLPTGFVCNPIALGDTCNTLYWQFRRAGIDLNTASLGNLPTLTPTQITTIANSLGLPNPNPFQGAQPIAMANNYESPRSWQWSIGGEREITPGWSVGADFLYVNTVHLERNRNLNLPRPVLCGSSPAPACGTTVDLSLRPCFGISGSFSACSQTRPIGSLGDVTLRATDARSRYNGLTFRTNYRRGRVQFQAYYTLSYNYSDDDNERTATGFDHDNEFDLSPEYNYSRLDARHLFLAHGLVDLPWGFTIGSLGKFRSGRPLEPLVGFDINGDNTAFPDRAFQAAGVSFKRNSFRDRRVYNVDLRVEKRFRLPREGMRLLLTADLFNLFNFANIVYVGGTNSTSNTTQLFGAGVSRTGAILPPASAFQQLSDPSFCLSPTNPNGNKGCYNLRNSPGSPFTAQLGIRFQF